MKWLETIYTKETNGFTATRYDCADKVAYVTSRDAVLRVDPDAVIEPNPSGSAGIAALHRKQYEAGL